MPGKAPKPLPAGKAFMEAPVIKPKWLLAMVPKDWMAVAIRLCEIQIQYDVTEENMARFIQVSVHAPVPLAEAVENLASGVWVIEVDKLSGEIHVKESSPIILASPGEIAKFN